MCGIIGYIATRPEGVQRAKSMVIPLLIESMSRGSDATGISFIKGVRVENRRIQTIKAPLPANEFVKTDNFLKELKENNPRVLIGHTRAKTQGDENNNMNNHPLFTKSGLSLVHNGVIQNDKELFEKFKLKRDAQVDSEIIIKMIEMYQKLNNPLAEAIQRMAKVVEGSMTIAMLNIKQPLSLYLMASRNPLCLAYEKSTGVIYFTSNEDFLKDALYKKENYFNMFEAIENENDFMFYEIEYGASKKGLKITPQKTTMFEIERPVWNSTTSNSTPTTSIKEDIEEEDGGVVREIVDLDFDIRKVIRKPSQYTTGDLEDRAFEIESIIEGQSFIRKGEKKTLLSEQKRLTNAINDRYRKNHTSYQASLGTG